MKSIHCKNCGANVKFTKKESTATCKYCNTIYYKEDFFSTNNDPISIPGETSHTYTNSIQHTKICKFCASKIDVNETICPHCGNKIPNYNFSYKNSTITNNSNYNKYIELFLCLILGMYGVHKFYKGKFFMGLIYLFTFGLFGIGWLIDCLVLIGNIKNNN